MLQVVVSISKFIELGSNASGTLDVCSLLILDGYCLVTQACEITFVWRNF